MRKQEHQTYNLLSPKKIWPSTIEFPAKECDGSINKGHSLDKAKGETLPSAAKLGQCLNTILLKTWGVTLPEWRAITECLFLKSF